MRVLITGGSGFIGSHLVDHLIDTTDADIIVLDDFSTGKRSNIEHIKSDRLTVREGDIRDESTVRDVVEGADAIYHLAAAVGVKKIIDDPLDSLRTNLSGTENVLKAAENDKTPTFIASSSEVYGKTKDVPFDEEEDRVLGPTASLRWSYATAKAADESMAFGYYREYDLPVVVARFFNIVGPRQTGQYGMVIPTFIDQALSGEPLTVYGDGTQTRSFTHVRDAVSIVYELLQTEEAYGDVYNIGTPEPISINELARRVIEITGSDSEITHIPFEQAYKKDFEEPLHREPDVTKLKKTIGRIPETDLNGILTDIIN
ncbi:GDP-mannose 4,6-dehydratase [Halobellus limi]|uniref:NAD-dependent epimerase/dehydratase family protein n=1 Tax=Halobellus limi TaxID=699433 RepID=A0A1H5UQZ4_9EURY|nr:GDP-mannose 4,6-dehydratase [Halobellus limi]QCC46952.1 NAD-dependent epimerase/dehydratase family protein [Halobellus limi]SEF77502.1 UDP-glucose 4-epimerase [Halobellus limi]